MGSGCFFGQNTTLCFLCLKHRSDPKSCNPPQGRARNRHILKVPLKMRPLRQNGPLSADTLFPARSTTVRLPFMSAIAGTHIVVGITGGIAAYTRMFWLLLTGHWPRKWSSTVRYYGKRLAMIEPMNQFELLHQNHIKPSTG